MLRRSLQVASDEEFEALCTVSHEYNSTVKGRLTRWRVSLESCDYTRFSDLIRSAVIHVHGGKKKDVTLLGDPRSDCFHNFAVDRLLIVGNKILIQ